MNAFREPGREAERVRLVDAFTKAAAERGYGSVSVEQIAAEAGVSPRVFEQNFTGKEQCLAAAYDTFVERLMRHIVAVCTPEPTWPDQVKAAIGATLEFFAEAEGVSRMFMVDATGAGPAALERRLASIDRLAELLRDGREHYPAAAALPDATERVLVAGIGHLISAHLLAEEASVLPRLQLDLVELVLTPYLGGSEARWFTRI